MNPDVASCSMRKVLEADAPAICAIYNPYVAGTTITFEQEPVSVDDMRERIRVNTASFPWLVAEYDGTLVGYAYATRWRNRAAYDQTVETTAYVRQDLHRSGAGLPLYVALLDALRRQAVHAAVGCIALPNAASVAFHEKCGFRKVAHFPEVGRKFGQWVDVGFWQLLL
jgi:L-amino acid N-acyltransferase YncA